jgi:thiol-disulfide isomerase/thioredoxin
MEPARPAVLIFLSTNCGPCLEMLPTLAGWQASLETNLSLPAIFAGERAEIERLSAEHGLSLVLAQETDELFSRYALRATPSGVLIGADGSIAGSPAEGVPAIEALIRSAVVPAQLVVHQT